MIMKKIFNNWNVFLNEQEKKHFEVLIALKYQKDFNLYGNVFNQIRAIDGISG